MSIIKFTYDVAEKNVNGMKQISETILQLKNELVTATDSLDEWKGKDNLAYIENVNLKASFLQSFSERITLRANQLTKAIESKRNLEQTKTAEAAKAGSEG